MTEFFAQFYTSTVSSLFVASMVVAFLMMLVQGVYNRWLRNAEAPRGIVSLELAGTVMRSRAILDSWNPSQRSEAIMGLWLDFLNLVSYAAALVLGCMWSTRHLGRWSPALAGLGELLAWLMVLAAVCDAIENVALLVQLQLHRDARAPWPAVAFACAATKFALIVMGVLYVLGGIASWVVHDPPDRLQIVVAVLGAVALLSAYLRWLPALVRFAFGHAALVLAVVLVYGIVYGQIGSDYGLVSLFWNDSPTTRISASLGVTLLMADLGVLVYYAAPQLVASLIGPPPWRSHGRNDKSRTVGENLAYLRRFLAIGGFPFLLLLLAPALLPAVFPVVPRSAWSLSDGLSAYGTDLGIWAAGIVLGLAVTRLILFAIGRLNRLTTAGDARRDRVGGSIVVFYLVFASFYIISAWPLYGLVSPAFAICALLAFLVMAYALPQYFIGYLCPRVSRWPIPAGAVFVGVILSIFAVANTDPYKLRFPKMEDYYPGVGDGPIDLRQAVREQYGTQEQPLPSQAAALISDRDALQK